MLPFEIASATPRNDNCIFAVASSAESTQGIAHEDIAYAKLG